MAADLASAGGDPAVAMPRATAIRYVDRLRALDADGDGERLLARLAELGVGDEVSVQDVDGGTTRYSVTEVADFAKADFPTARVFCAQPTDQLRLITCGGVFDRSVGHYEDNLVVFAEPVS